VLKGMALENVVQGHGEIVLRGEINETLNSSINYLNKMQLAVASALLANQSRDDMLREYDIESCGKTRIALNGLVQQLHAANLIATYDRLSADKSQLAVLKAQIAAAAPAKKTRKSKPKARVAQKPARAKAQTASPARPRKPASRKSGK
jgi:hypothetical protein